MNDVDTFLKHVRNPELAVIQRVQTVILDEMRRFAVDNGFFLLMPVLLSPFTDPLNHAVYTSEVRYRGKPLKLTASMIFHKQLALVSNDIGKVLIFSPNVRLEKIEIKSSANHLVEFSQLDFEVKNATVSDAMAIVESLYIHLFDALGRRCVAELDALGRSLPELRAPFVRYSSKELEERYGSDYYAKISQEVRSPCFITDFRREFYDREDPERPGVFLNFDLVYPEGYGEALSGAEREYRYEAIAAQMEARRMDPESFSTYLEVARRGLLKPSAGAGIGIERLLRFVCGKKQIADVSLFDRSLGSELAL